MVACLQWLVHQKGLGAAAPLIAPPIESRPHMRIRAVILRPRPGRCARSRKMSRARNLTDIIDSVPAAVRWKLDQDIDFEHRDARGQVIPQDLGRIADIMVDWQDIVADLLGLSVDDRNDIAERNPDKPKLQRCYKAYYEEIITLLFFFYSLYRINMYIGERHWVSGNLDLAKQPPTGL